MEWTSKEEYALSNFYDEFGSDYYTIIEKMNTKFQRKFTYDSVRNKIRRSSIIDYVPNKRGKGIFANIRQNDQVNEYTEAINDIKHYQDYFKKKYMDAEILVISDLHIPLVDLDALEEVIFNNQDADICVIAGDMLDYKSISSYGQKKEVSVESEYKIGFEVLKQISQIFNEVVIINGNHENRLKRYFSHKIVTALSGYLSDKHKPLQEITRFFDNVIYINHWFTHIFDIIFAHPSRYSKIKGRTAKNVVENRLIKEHEKQFGEFNTVIIGHSHIATKNSYFGRTAIENGCLQQLDTEFRDKDAKGNQWVLAYTRTSVRNHITNWNSSKVFVISDYSE